MIGLVSQFLTPVNQNSNISVANTPSFDMHPACETPRSQSTFETFNKQPTSETQDS